MKAHGLTLEAQKGWYSLLTDLQGVVRDESDSDILKPWSYLPSSSISMKSCSLQTVMSEAMCFRVMRGNRPRCGFISRLNNTDEAKIRAYLR